MKRYRFFSLALAGAVALLAQQQAATKKVVPEVTQPAPVNRKPQTLAIDIRKAGDLVAEGGFQEVRLVNAQGGPVAVLSGHVEMVRAVAFSPDGKLLAAAGGLPARKGELKIWDVEARKELLTVKGHSDCMYAVAFSPDGKQVATASYDKLIKLWDVATRKEIRTLKDHIDAVYALAYTPDGTRLVSGAADRSIKVWDPATGERLFTLSDPQDGINTVAVDPTGRYIAAGGYDKTIRVWSLQAKSAQLEQTLIAHEDAILKIVWSPDGKLLASSAADRSLKLFQSSDLSEVTSFPSQPDWVYGLAFSPDGKSLISAPFDGSFHAYAVSAPHPKSHVAGLISGTPPAKYLQKPNTDSEPQPQGSGFQNSL